MFDLMRNTTFDQTAIRSEVSSALAHAFAKTCRSGFSLSSEDMQDLIDTRLRMLQDVDDYFSRMMEMQRFRCENLLSLGWLDTVSLGEDCFPRAIATQWGLKRSAQMGELSGPFDLAVHPANAVVKLLSNDFHEYLDLDDLEFLTDRDLCYKRSLNITFNHEIGARYSDNNFELLAETYARRVNNFRKMMDTDRPVLLILHIQHPSDGDEQMISGIFSEIERRWPDKDFRLFTIRTWAHGASIPVPSIGADSRCMQENICYPRPGYIWHQAADCFSREGYAFEKVIVTKIRAFVNACWVR